MKDMFISQLLLLLLLLLLSVLPITRLLIII